MRFSQRDSSAISPHRYRDCPPNRIYFSLDSSAIRTRSFPYKIYKRCHPTALCESRCVAGSLDRRCIGPTVYALGEGLTLNVRLVILPDYWPTAPPGLQLKPTQTAIVFINFLHSTLCARIEPYDWLCCACLHLIYHINSIAIRVADIRIR